MFVSVFSKSELDLFVDVVVIFIFISFFISFFYILYDFYLEKYN